MSETITLTIGLQVTGGPKMVAAKTLEVEAYEKITVAIPNNSTDVQVELQPGGVGELRLLMITSDTYDDLFTYSPDGGTTTIALDEPQLFVGDGAVGVLGAPETLIFNKAISGDVSTATVQVLVGRDTSGPVLP